MYMEIIYNNKIIKNGEFLTPSQTQLQPKINYKNNNKLYTLLMYDPDAYKMTKNGLIPCTHIHFILTNISGNNIQNANIILPYKGPAPPSKTGKHRYIFELYEQSSNNNQKSIKDRSISNINEIKKLMNLDLTIYRFYFLSQNESDINKTGGKGKKRKTIKNKSVKNRTRRRY